ncbi:MAG: DUF1150 domain-containing protein [Alphaproteobacteria bacterium]|nr:DUF1150 domain-containing protein [Alphaproteobacteria bacterium]MBU0797436.1 DUF1150 domain-containing protein [Alphaproteobacteria bacterium]MBU0888555.1 DUF1150 domain-containing protein [Alphaproteobacteria bacterium]MBU1813711.1 DUF1150 domain-containing protein [Alphaproteobacteria bacterium]MBU2090328.1 DUF1150 domain-containing protein [Alphaproteobacteria bacterium]
MNQLEKIRHLSRNDLALLGMNDVAYVRPVQIQGQGQFAIHAADGTQMLVVDDISVAVATIRQNDMEPVPLH